MPVECIHTCHHLYDKEHDVEFTDTIEVHLIELPKLDYLREQHKNDPEIHWLQFINAGTKEALKMAAEAEPKISKAYEKLIEISQDEESRRLYDERIAYILDVQMRIQGAEEKAREEGC